MESRGAFLSASKPRIKILAELICGCPAGAHDGSALQRRFGIAFSRSTYPKWVVHRIAVYLQQFMLTWPDVLPGQGGGPNTRSGDSKGPFNFGDGENRFLSRSANEHGHQVSITELKARGAGNVRGETGESRPVPITSCTRSTSPMAIAGRSEVHFSSRRYRFALSGQSTRELCRQKPHDLALTNWPGKREQTPANFCEIYGSTSPD
jgi:hypothetical protein